MIARSGGDRKRPLSPIIRRAAPFLPLIVTLGLLASLLEGAGIGLFIPFLALLMSDSLPEGVPRPIAALAALIGGGDPNTRILLLGSAIFFLILLKSAVQSANDCLAAHVEGRIGRDLRNAMSDRLLSVDYPFFLRERPARLTRILSTDSWLGLEAVHAVLVLIPAAAGLLVFSVLLAWLNLGLFLVVLLGGCAMQALLYLAERRQQRLSSAFTATSHRLWERFLTLVEAPRVIRLFGQRERERQRTAAATDDLRRAVLATNYHTAVVHPFVDAAIALLLIVVIVAGYSSGMSVPAIAAFVLLLTRAQPHAKTISRARLGIASVHGAVKEVEWLLSQPPSKPAPAREGGHRRLDRPISFEDVSYTYPNGARALSGASFTIEPGLPTALIGKSGSGKTTLVNLLCRLIEPQSGEIRLGGEPASNVNVDSWRERIAVAGQDSGLVTGTIAENIAYARPDASAAEIADAARAAGADGFIAALPNGYDTAVGPDGLNLSGGQRQRVGLARAVLRNPDLLILDEATNAVDALTEAEIMALVAEHRFFRTILIISHRKTTLAACRRGIVLDNGSVCEAGPLADLAYFATMAGTPSRNAIPG